MPTMSTGAWLHATIGPYRLIEFVGAGGMGEVYRATDQRTGTVVAVKILTGARASAPLRARFRNEARIHAELDHPNIARMLEYLEHEGTPAIVMEFVDGETLEQRIRRTGPIPVMEAVAWATALVEAVAYLHRRTIVHRDIKSTNVKVSGDGVIKLLDFGIAKGPGSPALTADGSVIGTLQALAPEQLAGSPADLQTEIWALGVVLHEMVTGRHPFAEGDPEGITSRIRAGRYPAPTRVVPSLPASIDTVVGRCLRVDPRQRYPTCEALRHDLRQLERSTGPHLVAVPRWPRLRAQLPLIGALTAASAAIVFLAAQLAPGSTEPESADTPVPAVAGESLATDRPAAAPNARAVTINTLNGPAEVWRNGTRVGSTPYVLQVPLGEEVDLVLRRDGYRNEPVQFTVTEGRSEYNYVLQVAPKPRPISGLPIPALLGLAWFSLPWRRRARPPAGVTETQDRPALHGGGLNTEARIVIGTASDPGCVRDNNEDAVRVVRPRDEAAESAGLLAVVCDGMGGHAAGERASQLAVEVIAREYGEGGDPGQALARAVRRANRAVHDAARNDATLRGMGTTCTALVFRGGLAWCAHVGDSRCYLIRGGEIFLMTEDHSAVMAMVREGEISRDEARDHPDKNVISRALGSHPDIDVTLWPRPFVVRPGDRFLLSSDGLHDVVREEDIVRLAAEGPPDVACRELVAFTRERGAPDNISIVLLAVPPADDEALASTRSIPVAS